MTGRAAIECTETSYGKKAVYGGGEKNGRSQCGDNEKTKRSRTIDERHKRVAAKYVDGRRRA